MTWSPPTSFEVTCSALYHYFGLKDMSKKPTWARHSLFFHINLLSARSSRQLHFLLFADSRADGVRTPPPLYWCLLTVEEQTGSEFLPHFTKVYFTHYCPGYYPLNYSKPLQDIWQKHLKIQLLTLKHWWCLNAPLNIDKYINIWAFENIAIIGLNLVFHITNKELTVEEAFPFHHCIF